ncbi:hypothetical protein NIES30_07310 [Phormidium tenue NIES-30]|uniref:Uncharacterized protein n=1 Tax=Phormidium tenue NIES-30 TaxID=549789 RepID=A0A1U7J8J0_9CYAN|nr:hypothetical protein NIES30_07310 [Phormidium tenue NIES-30]
MLSYENAFKTKNSKFEIQNSVFPIVAVDHRNFIGSFEKIAASLLPRGLSLFEIFKAPLGIGQKSSYFHQAGAAP